MDHDAEDMIEWLRVLALPEADFRKHVRGYFEDTAELDAYIEERRPQLEAMRQRPAFDSERTQEFRAIPTRPYEVQEAVSDAPRRGRYKGKRRK